MSELDTLHDLDEDTLAALANRGLVKRAARELAAGAVPALTVGDPVVAVFADGATASVGSGSGLDGGTCTCAATGICRHLIGLVLAYQREVPRADAPATAWSPAELDDAALERAFGVRAVTAARARYRRGYTVVFGTGDVPAVELPTCTVRFPVAGDPALALTDAAPSHRAESVILAVWAFREGDEGRVRVGGAPASVAPDLTELVATLDEVLREGAVHAGPLMATRLGRLEAGLADLHWVAGALAEVREQVGAYGERSARYEPRRLADALCELYARARTGTLGADEPGETPLRRVRLIGLGCRITASPGRRTASVCFAHGDTTLVLRRSWDEETTGHVLGSRRFSGATLAALATANVVSEAASRSASRVLNLGTGRIARTSVTPVGKAWRYLPVVEDYAAHAARLAELPPRLVRPRVEAESVRVLAVTDVLDIGYDPGSQRLTATLADACGGTAQLVADHAAHTPAALDALTAALTDGPELLTAAVRRSRGTLHVTPLAVLTRTGVVVPDLAAGDDRTALPPAIALPPDPLADALDEALSALADAAHRGLRHLSAAHRARLAGAGRALSDLGFGPSATLVTAVAAEPGPATWFPAHLQVHTAADFR